MKSFFKSFKRQSGFTLVELMVVVAIIGLLTSVAIPNFQKFQARSKTTEAKLQLAAIYAAEASFFSEFTIYNNCLRYMGYDPSPERSSRYYTTGFGNSVSIDSAAYASAVTSGLTPSECPAGTAGGIEGNTIFSAGKRVGSTLVQNDSYMTLVGTSVGTQTVTTMTYKAGAVGVIHKSDLVSGMSINENKVISIHKMSLTALEDE
jgi:type IV pilus assembly protein PilA